MKKLLNKKTIKTGAIIGTTCHDRIEIGDNVMFGPNVQIYDHDHDYCVNGGLSANKYKTSPVIIGNNVWLSDTFPIETASVNYNVSVWRIQLKYTFLYILVVYAEFFYYTYFT